MNIEKAKSIQGVINSYDAPLASRIVTNSHTKRIELIVTADAINRAWLDILTTQAGNNPRLIQASVGVPNQIEFVIY